MTDQSTIFSESNPGATTPNQGASTPNTNSQDQLATLLQGIKNDRGEPKYKSLEDALVALKHSQDYIPQLNTSLADKERELAEARATASRVAELENVVQSLTSQASQTPTSVQGMTPEQIAELVSSTLSRKEQETIALSNQQAVAKVVAEKFGAEAEKEFYKRAEELGMTKQEINVLSAKSPKAVLSLLGIQGTAVQIQSKQPSYNTALNTAGIQPQTETFIGRNKVPTLIGATTQEMNEEGLRSRRMVEELHAQGKTINDLTSPKAYFNFFK